MAQKNRKCLNHSTCHNMIESGSVTGLCRPCYTADVQRQATFRQQQKERDRPDVQLAADRRASQAAAERDVLKRKYDESLRTIARLEKDQANLGIFSRGVETYTIEPKMGQGHSEGTVFWTASDWHIEERVDPRTVSGLNDYNLEIAQDRATRFFQSGLRLTRLLEQDIKIPEIVIPLLGDFISNDIHEEIAEVALLEPMHAIDFVRKMIVSGLDFVLNNSKQKIHVVCHSGNHGRTTKTTRAATENGHSLEYLMYLHLADYYRGEKERISFTIAEGMHSYVNAYDVKIRFHHGHMIRYQGGVGGIYIPVNKAIAQWNKARPVDLDVFGHFHQARDGGNFICNGSLIGYNAYAMSNKFDYEPPKQQLFLVDKKRGRTCTWPIIFKK